MRPTQLLLLIAIFFLIASHLAYGDEARSATEATNNGCIDCTTGRIRKFIEETLTTLHLMRPKPIPIPPRKPVVVVPKEPELPADLVRTKPPKSLYCGQPGHPLQIKFSGSNMKVIKELKFQVGVGSIKKLNSKGRLYSVLVPHMTKWYCDTTYEGACNAAEIKDPKSGKVIEPAILQKASMIADKSLSNGTECRANLDALYKKCSSMKDLSFDQRFKAISDYAEDIAARLPKSSPSFNLPSIRPHVLVCLANRESANFEPMVLNYTACIGRLSGANPIKKDKAGIMSNWISTANGMHQYLWPTLKDEWDNKWGDEKLLDPPKGKPDATFQSVYGTPMELFTVIIDKPKLQIEMIARYLDTLFQRAQPKASKVGKRKKSAYRRNNLWQETIANYDSRDVKTYVKPVLDCAYCLDKTPGNKDCLVFHPITDQKALKSKSAGAKPSAGH